MGRETENTALGRLDEASYLRRHIHWQAPTGAVDRTLLRLDRMRDVAGLAAVGQKYHLTALYVNRRLELWSMIYTLHELTGVWHTSDGAPAPQGNPTRQKARVKQ